MNSEGKCDLDRLPSRKERILGIVLVTIILLVFLSILLMSSSIYLTDEANNRSLFGVFVALILFFGSLILFMRVTFTKRQKPSKIAIRNIAYLLFCVSCAMIVLSLFVGLTSNAFIMMAIGILGIGNSKLLLNRSVIKPANRYKLYASIEANIIGSGMNKKNYILLISVLFAAYYGVFYIHSNSIYNIGNDIFEDDSYFEDKPPLVTDFIREAESVWFVNVEKIISTKETDVEQLYISSTILKGVSSCIVYYKGSHLSGEFSCKEAEPFWFLK